MTTNGSHGNLLANLSGHSNMLHEPGIESMIGGMNNSARGTEPIIWPSMIVNTINTVYFHFLALVFDKL